MHAVIMEFGLKPCEAEASLIVIWLSKDSLLPTTTTVLVAHSLQTFRLHLGRTLHLLKLYTLDLPLYSLSSTSKSLTTASPYTSIRNRCPSIGDYFKVKK